MCSQDSTDVYQNHNYVHSMESYFNIRDEDRQMINYFIYVYVLNYMKRIFSIKRS